MDNKDNFSIITQKDLLILKQLMEDGRKSSSSISKEIDLGREIVNYRIKRLIKENLIVKFIPKINEEAIKYKEYTIFLKLNLDDQISKNKFIKDKIGNKYLMWIVKSGSGWDLIVTLYAQSIDEFKEKLSEILEGFSTVLASYYTIITSEEIKESEKEILCKKLFDEKNFSEDFEKIKSLDIQIDEKDKEILSILEQDARIQYKEIAEKLDISSDTVKYRIDKMKSSGIIERFSPVINFSKLGMSQYATILKFKFLTHKEEEKINNLIKNSNNIIKGIKSLNMQEYFFNIVFEKEEELEKFKQTIQILFENKIDSFEIFKID